MTPAWGEQNSRNMEFDQLLQLAVKTVELLALAPRDMLVMVGTMGDTFSFVRRGRDLVVATGTHYTTPQAAFEAMRKNYVTFISIDNLTSRRGCTIYNSKSKRDKRGLSNNSSYTMSGSNTPSMSSGNSKRSRY